MVKNMKYTKAKLPDICTIKTGKHDANHANKEGKYRFYTCSNQYSMCDTYSFTGESVIVPGNGDIGLVFYYYGEFDAYQRTYVLNDITILPKYLFYHMQLYWRNFNDQKKFGSTVKYVRMSNFTNYEISYPSIEEQERIVAKIEELFSDLDNAVETLNATKAQLEVYKQAVLKNAFDGKLTNNGDPEIKELASFIEHPRYGTSKKCDYQNDIEAYTEVYRIPNIDASTGTLDRTDLKYAKFDEDEIEKLSLKYGDILIIRSNGSPSIVGTAAMVREQDVSGLFAGYLIRIRISDHEKLSPKYLLRYLSSYDARRYIENVSKSTSGVNNVNAQEIKKIKVPYFKKEIQDQIIYAIDSRLSAYENIEKTVNDALQQASAMRQSILKQAFEGRL
ncbi:restriction endonuclease subunit S [Streptococcus sp. CCUG 49591]|uniref:restriction endonuclease subunit S n=1 Tax=Streptococcus sp. CCUG 49591 TaxID=1860161 RepID=UPI0007DA1F69|nr:restriction endonuclease subunit S [Streptococcus sp. CCUG 49591]OAN17276.1 hypothetical protein A3Q39_01040 [Streptococcus sp. CCUG 49591]